jgi:F-type H+-transporting ATPase subunit b
MDALGINGGFLVAQLINFGVVFLALAFLAWGPLTKALDNRALKIAKQLEDADVAAKARSNAEAEATKLVDAARREAAKFGDEARGRGDEAATVIIAEARQNAEKILAEAREKAEVERNQQLAELRDQVAELAIAAAERLVGATMDADRQRKLVAEFFSKAPDAAKGLGGKVTVVTALPLTEAEQADVKAKTGASEISFKVDPSILGGLVIRAGDRVVDGSVRAGMSEIAARLN